MSVPPGVCFICRTTLDEGQVTVVKKRGVTSLIEVSVKRALKENQQFLQDLDEVTVHDLCRKRYSVQSNILASIRRGSDIIPKPISSRSKKCLGLKNICLLCGDNITEEFIKLQNKLPLSRRNNLHQVQSLNARETFFEVASCRGDEWGQQIINRLEAETDLIAAGARYHSLCHKKLYSMPLASRLKRPPSEPTNVEECMEYIYSYLAENREECQFSLVNLIDQIKGDYKPDIRTVKAHLLKHYGDKIIVVEVGRGRNHHTVVCFTDVGQKILYDNWYSERKSNPAEERMRVVKSAADIILEDIRSQVYDTTEYPPTDDFMQDVDSVVPESLKLLLETIVMKHKRHSIDSWKKKCILIGHTIISAVRPSSFLSSLKTSFGVYLYRKFGSKHLVNLCAAMGFCCSYSEATLVESSAIMQKGDTPPMEKGAFIQFAFDNADVNVNTLDGENTFHEMGGMMVITPETAVMPDKAIPRLKKNVPANTIGSYVVSQIKQSNARKNAGLSNIKITDVNERFQVEGDILPTNLDLLWLFGKSTNAAGIPGWNGFMEQVTNGLDFNRSRIVFLPFIHAPPTDYDTVLTSLLEASARTKAHGQNTCFVTYDQPLYIKARDIVENCQHTDLRNVVVRLGGFHLLMSFMGTIGAVMAGSGIRELLTTIYAENSVEKVLNGHAYSRAVRAHLLTNLALTNLIFDEIQFTEKEREETVKLLDGSERSVISSVDGNETFKDIVCKFKDSLSSLESKGPTSKLWVQYCKMTTLMKKFIQAERMGDWELHLETVSKMLPFFHSAGHFLYAKSARLYIQDMSNLQSRMDPREFSQFTKGDFTVRRSDKFWSGLWTDLSIEQVLMRSMKSQGGLTHGRGISTGVLSRWTGGMVYMLNICGELERFWNVSCITTEQHVDMRPTQIKRDTADLEKLKIWFDAHPPFPHTDKLLSLSSGTVGGPTINCHLARERGIEGVKEITNNTFGEVTFKRKNKVLTLASVSSSVKVDKKRVDVDPLTIFQRMCITKQSDKELEEHFKFELAPYPMSLFNEDGMCKGTKSTLYAAFTPLLENIPVDDNTFVVVDGGYLLHKVVWHRNESIQTIVESYITYTINHFGRSVAVVFDGYPEDGALRSTKTAERMRRYGTLSCNEVVFDTSTVIKLPQEKFLANDSNKRRLIDQLCCAFRNEGIETMVAQEDADCDIIKKAFEKSPSHQNVLVIGEDVDLLVLLCGLGKHFKNVYFQKAGRGQSTLTQFSSSSFGNEDVELPDGMELFIHAFSGCDTTSALFWQGKTKLWNILQKKRDILDLAKVFLLPDSNHETIKEAGEKCLIALYGGNTYHEKLENLRFRLFIKAAASAKVNLSRLPPTQEAASFHSFRTYHQVQMWLGNEKDPTEWGWSKSTVGLVPVTTTSSPAPSNLLKLISCRCKKGCTGACTCRKAGLKCSALCTPCSAKNCQNAPVLLIEEDEDDPDDHVSSPDEVESGNISHAVPSVSKRPKY